MLSNLIGAKVNPNIFVFHKSRKKNRLSILENGIKTAIGDSYQGISKEYTNNPIPAIFVNNMENYNDGWAKRYDLDVFRIDTTIITNTWFIDKHMKGDVQDNYLVTFDSIPPYAITLLHVGTF